MAKRPNIIVIYTDQQRTDSLGCYGNSLVQTPHIDALAAEGSLIEDCQVSCPICVPSRVAFWSGLYGAQTGSLGNQPDHLFSERYTDFGTHFRTQGYTTGLVGKNHCFSDRLLERAFDHHAVISHRGFAKPTTAYGERLRETRKDSMQMPWLDDPIPAEESITHWCFDNAMDFIRGKQDEPFLCWLSIPDPHPPFMVSEPYASMYDDVTPPEPIWEDGRMENRPFRHQLAAKLNRRESQYPGEEIAKLWRIYWGMVSQIDDGVGRLMSLLQALNLEEDTIVVYTSDHGDYLGDYRMVRKGAMNAPCLTHVPLIFHCPGQITQQRSEALASNVDFYPTLCELAGIPVPEHLHGFSLAKHLTTGSPAPRSEVFTHFGLPGRFIAPEDPEVAEMLNAVENPRAKGHALLSDPMLRGLSVTVRNHEWSYTRNLGEVCELYDRRKDPFEQRNLADDAQYHSVVETLKDRVYEWLATTTMGSGEYTTKIDPGWRPRA